MTARQHLIRAVLFLLAVLSPLGAPLIGVFLASACPFDPTVHATGPFALDFASCGISRPVEQLYQRAIFLPAIPLLAAGPVVGIPVAAIWMVAAAWCAWRSGKHFAGAIRARRSDAGAD